jgi:hypothetical protein
VLPPLQRALDEQGFDPPLDLLSRFAAAFFALEAAVLPAAPVADVTMRINRQTGRR